MKKTFLFLITLLAIFILVLGAAGSDAERYCNENANCVFVEAAQD